MPAAAPAAAPAAVVIDSPPPNPAELGKGIDCGAGGAGRTDGVIGGVPSFGEAVDFCKLATTASAWPCHPAAQPSRISRFPPSRASATANLRASDSRRTTS
eukprot:7384810-Prymnesium_polylepis.1